MRPSPDSSRRTSRKAAPGAHSLLINVGALILAAAAVFIACGQPGSSSLAVEISGVPGYIYYGEPFTASVHYQNRGPAATEPLTLTVDLPPYFEVLDSAPVAAIADDSVRWQLAPLAAGESGRVQLTLKGESYGVDRGEITLTAHLSSGELRAETFVRADTGELIVTIDIKPGGDPNSFNCRSKGNLPVAILSSALFDATNVDVPTVKLDTAINDTIFALNKSVIEDVNDDGFLDIVVYFKNTDVALEVGCPGLLKNTLVPVTVTVGTLPSFSGSDVLRIAK